jgi:hypothetical protein
MRKLGAAGAEGQKAHADMLVKEKHSRSGLINRVGLCKVPRFEALNLSVADGAAIVSRLEALGAFHAESRMQTWPKPTACSERAAGSWS